MATNLEEYRNLLNEISRELEEIRQLEQTVSNLGLKVDVDTTDLEALVSLFNKIRNKRDFREELFSPDTFAAHLRLLDLLRQKIQEVSSAYRNALQATSESPNLLTQKVNLQSIEGTLEDLEAIQSVLSYGNTRFSFPDESINQALQAFASSIDYVLQKLEALKSAGSTQEGLDMLIARLQQGKSDLDDLSESGYLAGDALKRLIQLAGNLSSSRGSQQLVQPLREISPTLPYFFKQKVVLDAGEEKTYRQVLISLDQQRKALSGGAPVRMVDTKTKEDIAELQKRVENLSTTFPSLKRAANEMMQVLRDVGQASIIGSEHVARFSNALQEMYKAFYSMGRSPQTSATQEQMRDTALSIVESAQKVFQDTAGNIPSSMQIPVDVGAPNVQVVWRHVGDYRESLRMLAQDNIDLAEITQKMVTQLADYAEAAGMAASEIKILGGEINAIDRSFALLYQATSDADGAIHTFKSKQYFAASGSSVRPVFEEGVYDVSISEQLSKEQLAIDKAAAAIKEMYKKLNQEIKSIAAQAKSDLGPEVIIGDIKAEVNEVTGAIEIVVSAIRKLDDGLTAPTEKVYKLQAALDTLSGTATIFPFKEKTREESILEMFPTPSARTSAKANIQALLSGTSFSLEKDAQALYDYNAQLVRISLNKRNLQGITEQLSITLDKNGNVVNDLRTRYSNFYQAISQNIVRLTRWAIAANLVYNAMNKLQELPSFMGKLDATTARLSTMTTLQREQVQAFFSEMMRLSDKYSVSLAESFVVSEKALQFTGGDTAKAAQLIGDAMLYSKVAVVDLSTAVDTLSAALAQLGLRLDQGDVLIGKWITLSKQYGVSVNDLARTYGSAGSVAMEMLSGDVGVAIDEFNALITATSRVTTLTSDQLSNFMRTALTNITSPAAISTLRRYGIEVESITGGYRDFYEILKDVYYYTKLYQATSPQALADISRAIGGAGGRQASRVQALIENMPMVMEIFEASSTAKFNYDDFVGSLTKNLEADITRLNSSFSNLLKTMGDEGLLETFSNIVKILTSVVDMFTELTKVTDNAVIRMALMLPQFQALSSIVGKLDTTKVKAFFSSFGQAPQGQLLGTGLSYRQLLGTGKTAGDAFREAFIGDQAWNTAGISIGMGVLSGLNAVLSGKSTSVSIATGLASAVGAAVGTALGGPPGAFIGSQITSLIAASVAEGFEQGARLADFRKVMGDDVTAEKLSDEMIKRIFEQERPTSEQDLAKIALRLKGIRGGVRADVLVKDMPFNVAPMGRGAATYFLPKIEEARKIYARLLEVYSGSRTKDLEELSGLVETPYTKSVSARSAARQEAVMLANVISRQAQYEQNIAVIRKRSLMDLISGNISLREYRDILASLPTISGAAAAAYDILGDYAKDVGISFDELTDIMATGNRELVDYLSEIVNQAMTYKSQISLGTDATKEYSAAVAEATEILGLLIKLQRESRQVDVPSFTRVKDYTQEDFMTQVYPIAQEYDKNKLLTYFFFNEEELRAMGYTSAESFVEGVIAGLEPLGLVFKDKFGMIAGISSEAMQFALQRLQETLQEESGKFNIQRLKDIGPERFDEIQKRNRYWLEYIAALRNMTANQLIEKEGQTFHLILGEENVWKQLLSVNEAMNFTLQDILDVEKKQLEGIWNIPEGATFWVPITSLFYQRNKETAYPTLPPLTAKPKEAEPETPVIPKPTVPAANVMPDEMRRKYDEMLAIRSGIAEGFANFGAMLKRFEDIFKAGSIPIPQPRPTTLPDTYFGQLNRAAQQYTGAQLSVVLPQPERITVESTANIQLILNERVLASIVRTFLARETSRTIKNRTFTVPLGKL